MQESRGVVSFFFFSSRRRHTRFDCDWSSDVCSSDLSTPVTASFGGHLFRSPANPEPGRDVVATIAGSLHMSVGNLSPGTFPAIGTSRRNVFGWFAQITEVQ